MGGAKYANERRWQKDEIHFNSHFVVVHEEFLYSSTQFLLAIMKRDTQWQATVLTSLRLELLSLT